jgi:hypothetical protein
MITKKKERRKLGIVDRSHYYRWQYRDKIRKNKESVVGYTLSRLQ